MHCNNWIFDMDGTLTDSMTVYGRVRPMPCWPAMAAPQNPTSTKRS